MQRCDRLHVSTPDVAMDFIGRRELGIDCCIQSNRLADRDLFFLGDQGNGFAHTQVLCHQA